MKRRSRVGRPSKWSQRRKALDIFIRPAERKRRSFVFEHLEARHYFSATPWSNLLNLQTQSLSSDTPEGAAQIWMNELAWAQMQADNATQEVTPQYTTFALPSDPLFANQWHLLNTGQKVGRPEFQDLKGVAGEDINVVPAWDKGYTGEGVIVAVIDNGVQTTHPDIRPNLHPTLAYEVFTGTNNPNPLFNDVAPYHGTAVAGLLGAVANNDQGGTGVAPGVTMIPIRLISTVQIPLPTATVSAFQFAANEVDITNNSWGPAQPRTAIPLTPAELDILRQTAVFGRGGLGTIHVFAAGNLAGPGFNEGFEGFGALDSAAYNPWVNSRYTIGVTGVDHDGLYANIDGTFTSYASTSAATLVAAPTGSNVAQNVADDAGQGSGIWTTDLLGQFGANAAPLTPGGFDPDQDFLADPNYTARFNGTSASTPLVSGVIALMLEANPNLTYRDVQEILLRSARQNAQFEIPSSGGGLLASKSNWITNQIGLFRNPDPWVALGVTNPFTAVFFPQADPNVPDTFGFAGLLPRFGHYESQPALFTNAAGYTVSQGYGVYGEQIGYAHGTIDAGLAVAMAEQWHVLDQQVTPERTFTTFVLSLGANLPAAEAMDEDFGSLIVPGAIGGDGGFIEYWNEYFNDDDEGPFNDYDGPLALDRGTYLNFAVPDNQAMEIESVEVKVSISGPSEKLDYLRMMLVSPEGTQSELNHFIIDGDITDTFSIQLDTGAPLIGSVGGTMDPNGGNFVWTFRTNRPFGERSSSAVIEDPVTGEPLMAKDAIGNPTFPITRGWEFHLENWSAEDFVLAGLEVVWHGKPLAVGTQRVQGFVGVDTDGNDDFNYTRYVQTNFDSDLDPLTTRLGDLTRQMDLTQEPFASNVVVSAHRVVNGVVENNPVARFLTGADGNYYFDLVPGEYAIRVTDPLSRQVLEDTDTDPLFLRHYKQEWRITPDWFFAPDRDIPDATGAIGEVFYDDFADAPVKFTDGFGAPVATGVKNVNFLLKQDAPVPEIEVNGTVYADLNGNGQFDGDDTPAGGLTVFWDANRDGVFNPGEKTAITSDDPLTRGQYTIVVDTTIKGTFAIGVIRPTQEWLFTNPLDGTQDLFGAPGEEFNNFNFFLDPPNDAFPPAGSNEPGNILGVAYNDRNLNGSRDAGEEGIPGFQMYIDANENSIFDPGEVVQVTSSNGTFFFSDVSPGVKRIGIVTGDSWQLVSPNSGFRQVQLGPGGTVTGVQFGLKNLAGNDWGDLPNTYNTLSTSGGPNHRVLQGFHLGTKLDGEVNGQPTADATGDDAIGQDDDGVVIITNAGKLAPGANTLRVTVAGVGGILNGWIDWNANGVFEASEHLSWQNPQGQIVSQVDLNGGTWDLVVGAPSNMAGGPLAARFRWGEANLGIGGAALFGEVEDYFLANTIAAPLIGDFDGNGLVADLDLSIWRATFGSTLDLRADANKNGTVDIADYVMWRNNLGAGSATGTTLASSTSTANSTASATTTSVAPNVVGWHFSDAPALQAWLQGSGRLDQFTNGTSLIRPVNFYAGSPHSQSPGGGSSPFSIGGTGSPSSPVTGNVGGSVSSSTGGASTGTFEAPLELVFINVSASHSSTVFGSAARISQTDSSLLLLDEVLTDFDADASDDLDDHLLSSSDRKHKMDDLSDMALAAVLEEEANWWDVL